MHPLPCVLLLTLPLVAQSQFAPTRHATLPPITVGDKFASGDLDGDGDIDLVVANDNSPNQLFLNDGRGRFTDATAARLSTPAPTATHSIDLADIDGDGDLDILIGNDDYYSNRVYLNNGAAVFTDVTATALPPNLEFTQNQVVFDFDGDGDVDWFTVDGQVCHLYANNGAGVFTDVSSTNLLNLPASIGERWQMTARAADVDGDGDLDLLVPTWSGAPLLILNQGGVLTSAAVQLPNFGGSNHRFVDIDGDGDVDILGNDGQVLLQNQGNGTFVNITATAFPSTPGISIADIDVDGDGDIDLVTNQRIWINNGAGQFTSLANTVTLPHGYRLGVAAADFDGDGDIDLPGRPNFLRQVSAAATPLRGSSYSVAVHTRPGVTSTVVLIGALAANVNPPSPFGALRLDQSTLLTLGMQNVATSPMTMAWQIPGALAFAGLELHYQALIIDPRDGPRLSNAIGDVLQ